MPLWVLPSTIDPEQFPSLPCFAVHHVPWMAQHGRSPLQNIQQVYERMDVNLTTFCIEYSNPFSRNCFASFLAVAISFLIDMPGNHAGSFTTGSNVNPLGIRQVRDLLTYREGGENDCGIGTQSRCHSVLHLCHNFKKFIFPRWRIIIVCAGQNDWGCVSWRNVRSYPSLDSTSDTYSNICSSRWSGVTRSRRRTWHALRVCNGRNLGTASLR